MDHDFSETQANIKIQALMQISLDYASLSHYWKVETLQGKAS